MTVTLYRWTLDRYHAAIEAGLLDDQPVELLQGNIVVMPPAREPHACYSSAGADYLRQVLGSRASIRETKPVTLPNQSEPIPDLANCPTTVTTVYQSSSLSRRHFLAGGIFGYDVSKRFEREKAGVCGSRNWRVLGC